MILTPLWERNLHMAVNPKSLIVYGDAVYVTERQNNLSRIDLASGQTIWSRKIPGAWGWTYNSSKNLYYMSQGSGLFVFERSDGHLITHHEFSFPYSGYVIANDKIIVTGGWRGYTNLSAYDHKSLNRLWSQPTKSKDLQQRSVPIFLSEDLLLSVNHSFRTIEIIDTTTGTVVNEITMPEGLTCPDLGYSYRMVDGKATFTSIDGCLYVLSDCLTFLHREKLSLSKIMTNQPYFSGDTIILRDTPNTFSLYDRGKKRTVWQTSIAHNAWDEVFAAQLEEGLFIVAGSYGASKFVKITGDTMPAFKTEKYIKTQLYYTNRILIYGTKGSIKAALYQL